MPSTLRLALVGDHDPTITAHQAIPAACALAAAQLQRPLEPRWLPTARISSPDDLAGFHGIWCVPGSPYRNIDGALLAIRTARTGSVPFLGTCGGFQHAVLEYARAVLGWTDAEHAETAPDAVRAVIGELSCSLVEVQDRIRFAPGSRVAQAYGAVSAREGYHCRYGINPRFASALTAGPLRAAGWDESGEIRVVELDEHPFFVGTLFQPERGALRGAVPPLVRAFLAAVGRGASIAR